ncbi:MAG: hypothetical protein KCHDKBKB_01318 [Elusimicrobia bacterium]|nr:hypothetical protein [Elusimicrobiota bacterium]
MKKRLLIGIFPLLMAGPISAGGFEVAPFYGVRFGGQLQDTATGDSINFDPAAAVGATVNMPLPGLQEKLEFLYSHQETGFNVPGFTSSVNVRVDEWQVGLLREYEYEPYRPFLVGTLGATNLSFSGGLEDTTLFSVGLGGGVKYFPTERIGFRLDARGYVSFVEGSGAIACSGGCVVGYQGSVFMQGEILPSIVVIF